MPLNIKSKTSYHQFDEWGMLTIPSDQSWEKRSLWKRLWDKILKREWTPMWSDKSWMDSLGRTVLAWIAYGMPEELDVWDCVMVNWKKKQWVLYRHPNHKELSSRDHWSYLIIYNKLSIHTPKWFSEYFIPGCPRMRGMNNWMKALTGDKRAEKRYYRWAIPGARLGNWWLRFCRRAGGINEEWDNQFWIGNEIRSGETLLWQRPPRTRFWAKIIFQTIPAYALHVKAWQIYVMPESQSKTKLKRILLQRVGKSNIMLRLLLEDRKTPESGDNVTQKEIENYPHMTGYRPGVYLDETCRRDIREMTPEESEFNSYEKSLIQYLWTIMK